MDTSHDKAPSNDGWKLVTHRKKHHQQPKAKGLDKSSNNGEPSPRLPEQKEGSDMAKPDHDHDSSVWNNLGNDPPQEGPVLTEVIHDDPRKAYQEMGGKINGPPTKKFTHEVDGLEHKRGE